MRSVFIIAEAGVNHNGDIRIAKKMVDVAANAGVNAIKFQTFKAESLVSKYTPKADYQKRNTGIGESQFAMIKKLELSNKEFKDLYDYCNKKRITFLSSPFDIESISFLQKLGMQIFKIPSGELTNLPYLREIASLAKRLILSTGMADLSEIRTALEVLVANGTPRDKITVLQCTTEYPTPYKDVNLLAMNTIRDTLHVKVGYSDHTQGIEISIAAAALGACIIEKHFTLDNMMSGPDHRASLMPEQLALLVQAIRNVEKSLGNGIKCPCISEKKNKRVARKSIVASRNIAKDEVFSFHNVTIKRPGTGISPMEWDSIIGQKATRSYKEDELIKLP